MVRGPERNHFLYAEPASYAVRQGNRIVLSESLDQGLTGESVEAVSPAGDAESVLCGKGPEAGELIPVPDNQQHKQDASEDSGQEHCARTIAQLTPIL